MGADLARPSRRRPLHPFGVRSVVYDLHPLWGRSKNALAMINLVAAAPVFVLMHLLISGTRLRDALVGVIGQGPYMGLFSLASVAALAWLIFAFGGGAERSGAGDAVEQRAGAAMGAARRCSSSPSCSSSPG